MKLPEAIAAADEEWDTVKNFPLVCGSLPLEACGFCETCPEEPRKSCVLGGTALKDDNGYRAVFAEQGASASQMTPATFLDTLSRLQRRITLKCAGRTLPEW